MVLWAVSWILKNQIKTKKNKKIKKKKKKTKFPRKKLAKGFYVFFVFASSSTVCGCQGRGSVSLDYVCNQISVSHLCFLAWQRVASIGARPLTQSAGFLWISRFCIHVLGSWSFVSGGSRSESRPCVSLEGQIPAEKRIQCQWRSFQSFFETNTA